MSGLRSDACFFCVGLEGSKEALPGVSSDVCVLCSLQVEQQRIDYELQIQVSVIGTSVCLGSEAAVLEACCPTLLRAACVAEV